MDKNTQRFMGDKLDTDNTDQPTPVVIPSNTPAFLEMLFAEFTEQRINPSWTPEQIQFYAGQRSVMHWIADLLEGAAGAN